MFSIMEYPVLLLFDSSESPSVTPGSDIILTHLTHNSTSTLPYRK